MASGMASEQAISAETSVVFENIDVYKRQSLDAADFTTVRIALAIRPCLPMTLPISSESTLKMCIRDSH